MNITYSLVSSKFTGEVRFTYNIDGLLIKYEVTNAMTSGNISNILKHLPKTYAELQALIAQSKTAQVTEVIEEITFDMMWKRYNDSGRSSKKKSLARWNKFNTDNQRKSYFYYPTYVKNIPPGVEKKYLETYLNAELWNN
jgi:hypothetical protein